MIFKRGLTLLFGIIAALTQLAADGPKLLRAISGPSGTIVGTRMVIDDTRNRFVYPADKSLTVYFEWEVAPGAHALTAIWKQPDGKIASISPDVKMIAAGTSLNGYWVFSLDPGLQNGVWTVEIRMDGQPAGSHFFEIAGMAPATAPPPAAAPPPPSNEPKLPTLDDMFKAVTPSLVWIHKLDASGRRFDTGTGFIMRENLIASAFQTIDSAATLEIEFADGKKVAISEIQAWSRTADWALLRVDTGTRPPVKRGDPGKISIGERLIVFNFESGARAMGGVDITGRRTIAGLGPRIQFSPDVATEAAGGPLLNAVGLVVGILGGSLNPAARIPSTTLMGSFGLWRTLHTENAAVPISEIPENVSGPGKTLQQLDQEGVLTAYIDAVPELHYAGTAKDVSKGSVNFTPHNDSNFSTKDAAIFVYSMWVKKRKVTKGEVGVKVYDQLNRLRVTGVPKRVNLTDLPERVSLGFSPSGLQSGIYRVDILWNQQAVWRGFVKIQD